MCEVLPLEIRGRQAVSLRASQRSSGIKLAGGDEVGNRKNPLGLQYDHTGMKVLLFFTREIKTFRCTIDGTSGNFQTYKDRKMPY